MEKGKQSKPKKKTVKPKAVKAKAKKVVKPKIENVEKIKIQKTEKEEPIKKESISYLKRDRCKYELNGNGEKLGKGKIVLALVKKFMADKPQTTFEELGKAFPVELQKGYKGVFAKVADVKKNELEPRYFTDAGQLIKTADGISIAVVREFGAGNIPPILAHAIKLGYKIKEYKIA